MKFLVLGLLYVASASARPEVSGSYLPSSGGSSILSGTINEPSGSYIPSSSGSSILSGSIGGGYNGYNGGGHGGLVQDQRHVFFYAAPDDEGPARFRVNIAPSSHRNTKIIFVKTPSYGGVIPEVIAPPSQAEDKTLVYVLVKKQQHGGAITIPSSLGVKQAKPEVYFIKYRNQHDAEQAVQSGLNGQSVGAGLSDLGSEGSFIRSLSYGGGGGLGGLGGIGDGSFIAGGGGGSSLLMGPTRHIAGSILLGGTTGGISSIGEGLGGTRYGTPGASGPYKR